MATPVITFMAGLGLMGRDGELVPYDSAPIEAASQTDAILLARQWAQDATLAEDSHLQVLLNGEAVASLKPASFDFGAARRAGVGVHLAASFPKREKRFTSQFHRSPSNGSRSGTATYARLEAVPRWRRSGDLCGHRDRHACVFERALGHPSRALFK